MMSINTRVLLFIALIGVSGTISSVFGQDTARLCEKVLVPTTEQVHSDYRKMQAFMSINASHEYERLQNTDTAARNADATYEVYSAEYHDSQTKEQFSEKVHDRLQKEHFNLSESDARSYLRIGVSDKQVDAWQKCMHDAAEAGGLMLTARNVTSDGFTLLVTRSFPKSIADGEVKLQVTGGTFKDGSFYSPSSLSERYSADGSKAYEVIRNAKAPLQVRVQGNLRNAFPDSILVDYSKPPRPPDQPEVPFNHRYTHLDHGGYTKWDEIQKMIVSGSPTGGPSENFSVTVDVPRAGDYFVDVMWTAPVPTEVWVYTKPIPADMNCQNPNLTMHGEEIHDSPVVTGGWGSESLPPNPQRLNSVIHISHPGQTKLTFTAKACGGGLAGGRLPSTAWVELTEKR